MLLEQVVLQPDFLLLLALLVWLSRVWLREDEQPEARRAADFKRLALRFHPERCAPPTNEETIKCEDLRRAAFSVVAEAFEVLKDPLKRAVYEQYGEEGLKKGVVAGGPGTEGCIEPYFFHGQPLRTYREFFGTENPYADLLDGLENPVPIEDCQEARGQKKKDEPVIKALPLSLNEVFYGGIKKMKIQRLVLVGGGDEPDCGPDEKGTTRPEEKILSIPIMPGMPAGARIVFPEEGDQTPTKIPADIIFVTEDKPHETFKREGSNLRMTVNVFLREALNGTIVTVNTVDDRILRVPITSVISPDYIKTISGEGLPLVEDPERRGDLIISFNVEFPSYLPPSSKLYVQKAFERENEASEDEGNERIHRMLLAGKMYMRARNLEQICRP